MMKQNASCLPKKKGAKYFKAVQDVASILLFLVVWEILVRVLHIREAFLCTPSSAIYHLFWAQPDADYHWIINISATLKEFAISFAVTAVGAVFLAVLISWSKTIQNILMPAFIFINSLPVIAIAPILLIWIGYGLKTNIVIAFLVSFFPMLLNTITGLNAQDKQLLDLVNYLDANRWQILFKIQIPGALPYIFAGLKISGTLCIMGVIVGELIASDVGLGYVIVNAQSTMDTPPMFASLIMMSILGWGMYLFITLLERLLMPWNFVKERVDS